MNKVLDYLTKPLDDGCDELGIMPTTRLGIMGDVLLFLWFVFIIWRLATV